MVTKEGLRYGNRQSAASCENPASTQHFTAGCDGQGEIENPGEPGHHTGHPLLSNGKESGLEFWLELFFFFGYRSC